MSLVFEDVSFSYDGERLALSDIELRIDDGDFIGIVGHTGSGKSTLVQLMDALLVPTKGRVVVDGMDTADRSSRRAIRERVGVVFQYPENQLFAPTVAEDVAFGPKNLGLSGDEVERRCRRALERVGLSHGEFASRSPFELSGGQKRRVAIAGVLAMEPSVLVLDEPAAGMDPQTAAEIRALLHSFNADGLTIVLVSHSMEDIAELCGHVIVMNEGHVLMRGTPAQVFAPGHAAELRRVNLGLPRATKFAIELAEKGLDLQGPILTRAQLTDALVDALNRGEMRDV